MGYDLLNAVRSIFHDLIPLPFFLTGVDAIRPPINLTVQFLEPLLVPGQVIITFWETVTKDGGRGLHFQMEQHANSVTYVDGLICRT